MNRTFFLALATILPACSGGDGVVTILDDFASGLESSRAVMSEHVHAVEDEDDVDAIGAHEQSYMGEMAEAMDEMTHAMDDLDGCEMREESMGMCDSADSVMDELMEEAQTHVDAHEGHLSPEDCFEAEESHREHMEEMFDALDGYPMQWEEDEELSCEPHDHEMGGHMG